MSIFSKQSSSKQSMGIITRTSIALAAVLSGLVLAWTTLGAHHTFAAGLIETPTQTNPWGITMGANGTIWVAEPGCDVSAPFFCQTAFPTYIGEYDKTDTLIQNFAEPANFSSPVFIVLDKKGRFWFTETNSNAIGMFKPGNTPVWKQWTVPTTSSRPYDLTLDANGNIWFSEFSANKIGFFNTTTKTFVETAIPSAGANPYGITTAPNGHVWFVENSLSKIGEFTPTTTGKITIIEHIINTPSPHLITADKAGNIWYSQGFSGVIGEYVPSTGVHKDFQVANGVSNKHISGIATDSTGKVWFDDSLSARVGYLIPSTGAIKTLTLSNSSAHPHDGLLIDTKGNTWFTELYGVNLGLLPVGTL